MFSCLLVHINDDAYNPVTRLSCFFDINGQCLDHLVNDQRSAYEEQFIEKYSDVCVKGVFVIFINSNDEICGWFQNAELFQLPQFDMASDRVYRATCKTDEVFLLKADFRVKPNQMQLEFREFSFLDEPESREMIDLIKELKISAQFVNLSMMEVPVQYESLLDNCNAHEIIGIYQHSGDAFILPVLLRSAQAWSISSPQDPTPWDYIGFSYLELAKPARALQYFEHALEVDPNHMFSAIDKGKCLIRLDRANESIKWLNDVRIKHPEDEECLYYLSQAYLFAGFPQTSYRLLKQIQSPELQALIEPEIRSFEEDMPYLHIEKQNATITGTYPLIIDFSNEALLETYVDVNGTTRYVDPIRKKGIVITPEETVRQNLIIYLINNIGIPVADILVEESFSHIDRELKKRVDIVIRRHRAGRDEFLLLIECKAPGITLEGAPTAQLIRYNEVLQAPFVMLSNSEVTFVFQYNNKKNEYTPLLELPTYDSMCCVKNIFKYETPEVKWKRPSYEKLLDGDFITQYVMAGTLGEETPFEIQSIALNLNFCLLDEDHRINCPMEVPGCQLVADYGVVALAVGNAGGGTFDGYYRWLGVIDRNGNRFNVYISIFGVMKAINEPRWGTRKGVTTMVFAIEENGTPVSRLQLRLDDCLLKDHGSFLLTHNGKRSRAKVQPLIRFIEKNVPTLLGTKAPIELGYINNDQDLFLSNSEIAQVIGNAVTYLLLRSELRALE